MNCGCLNVLCVHVPAREDIGPCQKARELKWPCHFLRFYCWMRKQAQWASMGSMLTSSLNRLKACRDRTGEDHIPLQLCEGYNCVWGKLAPTYPVRNIILVTWIATTTRDHVHVSAAISRDFLEIRSARSLLKEVWRALQTTFYLSSVCWAEPSKLEFVQYHCFCSLIFGANVTLYNFNICSWDPTCILSSDDPVLWIPLSSLWKS